ncbi:hypothetical protein D3C81_1924500 [compost metagenome]
MVHADKILFTQPLKAQFKGIVNHRNRGLAHALAQALGQMIGANHAAFIFQHPAMQVLTAVGFQHLDRQQVFKTGLAQLRLNRATKRRAAMVRQTFEIHAVWLQLHQLRFTAAGTAAN